MSPCPGPSPLQEGAYTSSVLVNQSLPLRLHFTLRTLMVFALCCCHLFPLSFSQWASGKSHLNLPFNVTSGGN